VDLALDRNVAVVLSERAERLTRFGFPNDRDGYDYFYRRLKAVQERQQAPAVLVGMEPTNYFWKLLASDMEQRQPDHGYRLVNPYTVKKNREGDQLDRSKDDNRDAFTICDLLRTGKYTQTRLLHGAYAELRQYVTLHTRLKRDIRRQKTLIRNVAGQLFPELPGVFKDFSGETALAMLRHHASATVVQRMSEKAFIARVRANFPGRRLQVAKLRRAHGLAARSVGLKDGVEALQLALRLHIGMLRKGPLAPRLKYTPPATELHTSPELWYYRECAPAMVTLYPISSAGNDLERCELPVENRIGVVKR
jgi:transposase